MRLAPKVILVWVVTLLLSAGKLCAQSVRFKHISNQEGLSQNTVTSMAQDARGYIWMGTQDGLNRYDGYNFLIFKNDPADSASLASNWILSLLSDSENRLWIGSSGGGLQVLMPGTSKFAQVIQNKIEGETVTSIQAIGEDSDGNLWAASSSGMLYKIESENSSFRIDTRPLPSKSPVYSIKKFRPGKLLLASRGSGALVLDTKTGAFTPLLAVLGIEYESEFTRVLDTYTIDSSRVIIGTDGEGAWDVSSERGLRRIFLPEESEKRNPPIRNVNADKNGSIWLGSDGFGAFRYYPSSGVVDQFGAFYTDDYSLSDNSIYSSLLDRQGVFWIGTFLGGVNTVDAFNNRFFTLGVTSNPKRTLSNPMVRALQLMPDGKLWIGTRGGGLHVYTPNARTVDRPFGEDVMDQRLNALFLDSKQRSWIGTWGGGLYVVENGVIKKHFVQNPDVSQSLPDNRVRTIFEDSQNRIWIALGQIGQGTLVIFNEKSATFSVVKLNRKGLEDPAVNTINHIYEDDAGRIWLSTFGGLLRLSAGNGAQHATGSVVEYFRHDPTVPRSLGHNVVNSITRLTNGEIWLASYGLGIAKITENEPGKLLFDHVTEKDGLPTNGVFGILEDKKGNLWLGTNKGITKYNPTTKAIRQFYKSDGLTSNQINQGAYFKSQSGLLFFGTAGGLTLFDPEMLKESEFKPNVIFNGFQVFGKSLFNPLILTEKTDITLTYDQNFLTFEFSALDFSSPSSILYQCFLEGFDKSWNQLGNRRVVNYTNLNPGRYTMVVRSTNSDGVWSGKEARLRVYIVPPFYKTTWFYIVSLFVLSSAIFLLLNFRERVLNARNRELEEAVAARTAELEQKTRELEIKSREAEQANKAKSAFLAGMSHELRTPLNAILGFSQILFRATDLSTRYREFAETMYRSGNHLLSMINDVLDISKIEAGRMEIKPVDFDLSAMLNDLEAMFRLECRQKNLSFSLEIETDVPEFVVADNNKIRQILINLIGNAVKYTSTGGITIHVASAQEPHFVPDFESGTLATDVSQIIWFRISDTGQGIEADFIPQLFEPFRQQEEHTTSGTGLGLAITSELVKLMGGKISVSSQMDKGSTFYVALPLKESEKGLLLSSRDALSYIGVKGNRTWTVLIVDDIASNIELLHVMLERLGFRCVMANDGKTGLDLYDAEKPDIVLLDLRMPGMRGEEVMRRIRRKPGGDKIPIIAITASVFEENEQSLLEEGFSGFIIKPFHQNDLFEMMEKLAGVPFETEVPPNLIESETREDSVEFIGKWILEQPDEIRFPLSDAVLATDLTTIVRICEPLCDASAHANQLFEQSSAGNYRLLLALADYIDTQAV